MSISAKTPFLFLIAWLGLLGQIAQAQQVVTYQGSLKDGGVVATGLYDIQFTLYDAPVGGVVVDGPITREDVPVQDGVFSTQLSFAPGAFNGQDRWLEVALRDGASTGSFEVLQPRQQVTGAPQAHVSLSAAPDSVGTLALQDNAVTGSKIATDAVDSTKIADGSLTGADLADGAITGSKIAPATITVSRLANNAVSNAKLRADAVDSSKIVDGSITAADVDSNGIQLRITGVCGAGEAITAVNADGSVTCAPDTTGSDWSLTGNAITPGQFLGTTNNQPLELAVNNQRSLRIDPETATDGPNWLAGYSGNSITSGVMGGTISGGGAPDDGLGSPDHNRVTDNYGTIGGGWGNQAGDAAGTTDDRAYATVGGGQENTASGLSATVGGGSFNTASYFFSTVGGGAINTASGSASTVGGGDSNTASGLSSTVGGGWENTASGDDSTVSGGNFNAASGTNSTVGGGDANTASASNSTVGGGINNTASGLSSTVGGGWENTASGNDSTVSGGATNTASGGYSTVPGGSLNQAGGDFSFAAGRRAKVRDAAATGDANGDEGTFVWADSQNADFTSTGPDQFRVRARGGAYFEVESNGLWPAGVHIQQTTSTGVGLYVLQTSNDATLVASNNGTGDLIRAFSNNNLRFRVTNIGDVLADGTFTGGGADFAEYLPAGDENLRPGEVVALKQGRLWRNLDGAERVFVISTAPAFTGNAQADTSGMALAAFMGQVPVKVKGPVQPGDWLLAAGEGAAVAVKTGQLAQADLRLVVGRALKAGEDGQALALVGLPPQGVQQALQQQLAAQQKRIVQLERDKQQLRELKQQVAEVSELKQQLAAQSKQLAEMQVLVKHLMARQAAENSRAALAQE